MDRIEKLLDRLHAESSWEMVAIRKQGLQHRERRVGLQKQIADEWREMVEALEGIRANCPCDPDINEEWWAAWSAMESALARTKGVIVNNPNG